MLKNPVFMRFITITTYNGHQKIFLC